MPYQIQMEDDGILRIDFAGGSLERDEVDNFVHDFTVYLDAATPEAPLCTLTIADQSGAKLSSKTRKAFTDLNNDPRLGKAATVGIDRYTRVLVGFVLKATGRDNIRFFETVEQALAWLRE
ncbi:MAG: hypothetical protein JXR84_01925 [Anaerolineae bacterium]|nr:hypothetical protein [Anaerolineae bacterium]